MELKELYRRRLIPAECLLLKDDEIVEINEDMIITRWKTLNPKPEFSHGVSCYLLKEGIKVSKIYRHDDSVLHWYCDIVDYDYDEAAGALTVTDLLADVIVYPDGRFKVVDLDELAEAMEKALISPQQMTSCLYSLNNLLTMVYRGKFDRLQSYIDHRGL